MTAANSTGKQRGRPFKKGQSGNPAGRPAGSRNRVTLAAESLLDGEAEELTRKCIELAKAGDTTCLRLCMERLVPARKTRRITFDPPASMDTKGLAEGMGSLIEAVACGDISPDEAQAVAALFEGHRRAIETQELEERIRRLEANA